MRTFCRAAFVTALALCCAACAAAETGKVAGNAVGGAAWVAMKGGGLAFKGGSFVVKTTGRTVVGAARGIHEEFSKPQAAKVQTQAQAQPSQVAALSQ